MTKKFAKGISTVSTCITLKDFEELRLIFIRTGNNLKIESFYHIAFFFQLQKEKFYKYDTVQGMDWLPLALLPLTQ